MTTDALTPLHYLSIQRVLRPYESVIWVFLFCVSIIFREFERILFYFVIIILLSILVSLCLRIVYLQV
jgi:hypothetical protein